MSEVEALTAPTLEGARHGFFLRGGGVSAGLYESLNCGPGSADRPEAVAENRARAAAALGVAAERLLTCRQTHSARAIRVSAPWSGEPPLADALVTTEPGLAVAALAADCAPALFVDREAGVVAAAHSGWAGALGGVLEATLDAMAAAGARRSRVQVVVGPCISQRAYEVGPEFVDRFIADDPDNARFFAAGAGDRAQFDLPSYALSRLRAAGVADASWLGLCTHGAPDKCFSFRRSRQAGEPDYGRMISAIRLS
jgi:YfiH family protein